eukprot:TRINITY_DN3762_c0_g1_i3.p1 TRINITY_DN3762_c0_g1~~TRINITY_DN3762_c0_g1_i3.p1  ORF type:complete len:455 (-),score=85.88 TRINITY_DN3762_c0_g1_i3:35-1399(-)
MASLSVSIYILCVLKAIIYSHLCIMVEADHFGHEFLLDEKINFSEIDKETVETSTVAISYLNLDFIENSTGVVYHKMIELGNSIISKIREYSISLPILLFLGYISLNNISTYYKNNGTPSIIQKEGDPDVIIIGAGIAGCAVAKGLADTGKKVVIFEKKLESNIHRMVGEFLQPGGIKALKQLGLEDCIVGIEEIVNYGYAISIPGNQSIVLNFPNTNEGVEVSGRSFRYGCLVENLRKKILEHDNIQVIEKRVNSLLEYNDLVIGVNYKEDAQVEMYSPLVIVCDGSFSRLRKKYIDNEPVTNSYYVGLILENIVLPHRNYGNVFLTDPYPVLSYQICENETRILIEIPRDYKRKQDAVGYILQNIVHQLPIYLQPEIVKAVRTNSRIMPIQELFPVAPNKQGLWFLGDSWNMRHPLTGGGMTVAFKDAVLVSKILEDAPLDSISVYIVIVYR